MRWPIAIGAWLAVTASAASADPRYPDWPCVQAKVPEISLAAVWAGPPLDDIKDKWENDARVSALVPKLAARRTPLEDAQKAIAEFLGSSADKTTAGKLLFTGLFDTLNGQRSSVMNGLERITRKQRTAAEKIQADAVAMQALQGSSSPDQSKIEELGNQLVWQTRIFEERQRVVDRRRVVDGEMTRVRRQRRGGNPASVFQVRRP